MSVHQLSIGHVQGRWRVRIVRKTDSRWRSMVEPQSLGPKRAARKVESRVQCADPGRRKGNAAVVVLSSVVDSFSGWSLQRDEHRSRAEGERALFGDSRTPARARTWDPLDVVTSTAACCDGLMARVCGGCDHARDDSAEPHVSGAYVCFQGPISPDEKVHYSRASASAPHLSRRRHHSVVSADPVQG